MSEENPSAESGPSSVTQSLGEEVPAPSVPRQTLDEAPTAPVEQTLDEAETTSPKPAPIAGDRPEEKPGEKPAPVVATLATEEAPAPRKRRGLLVGVFIGAVVIVLLAAISIVLLLRYQADPTAKAAVGSCLASLPSVEEGQDKEATGTRIVDCSDAAATHRVEGRLNNQTEEQARQSDECKDFPEATFSYRAIPAGRTGYVLCLKSLK